MTKYNKVFLIIEFGSKARGDDDRNSDHDIFVLCSNLAYERFMVLKSRIAKLLDIDKTSVSIYNYKNFEKMLIKGRLFVWHLKLEGKVIFTRINVNEIFSQLKPYRAYKEDLTIYFNLLKDCKRSITEHGVNSFDLSMLFTICRNTYMVICYRKKNPAFGRLSVYYKAKELLNPKFLLFEEDYLYLSRWKLYYERGIEPPNSYPKISKVNSIIKSIENLLKYSLEV